MTTIRHNNEIVLSCISVITDDDMTSLKQELHKVHEHLAQNCIHFEILLISPDINNPIYSHFHKYFDDFSNVRLLNISHSISEETAQSAATENAIGDIAVIWKIGRDSKDAILDVANLVFSTGQTVMGQTKYKRSIPYIIGKSLLGFAFKLLDGKLPSNATGLWGLTRDNMLMLNNVGGYHLTYFARISKISLPVRPYHYQVMSPDQVKKKLTSSISSTWRTTVFNSLRPLRLALMIALSASLLSLFLSIFVVLTKIFGSSTVEGWASLLVAISFFFCLLFSIFAILGEYLARFLDEVLHNNDFIVTNELLSKAEDKFTQLNITTNSDDER